MPGRAIIGGQLGEQWLNVRAGSTFICEGGIGILLGPVIHMGVLGGVYEGK